MTTHKFDSARLECEARDDGQVHFTMTMTGSNIHVGFQMTPARAERLAGDITEAAKRARELHAETDHGGSAE